MNDWIIITPEGITVSSTEIICENFQVLEFVFAASEEAALGELKEKYPYLNGSGLMKYGFTNWLLIGLI
jgi:hypothetical protein